MKKTGTMIAALLAGAAFAPEAAQAQTRGGFEVGTELFDYSYREQLEGQAIVRDDGRFIGLTLGYVGKLGDGWFLRGRLSGAAGSVDYRSEGSIIDPDGEEARLENVSQGIGNLEVHIGRDFMLSGGTSITPFVGFASRVLDDNSGGEETEDGLLGYDRQVSYAYVPTGLAVRTPVGGGAALTFSAQYNWLVGGEAESKFSDLDPEALDVKVDLNGGYGLEFSAIAEIPVGRDAVRFGPFIRHWSIKQSDSFVITNPDDPTEALELFEPKNRTTEIGLRLSFAF
jgi:hypothetical protein